MLELTDQARKMIERLTAQRSSPSAGLRIARRREGFGLWMSLADEPAPGDVVVRSEEASVYLDDTARKRLSGRTLDARSNAQGAAFFI